MVILTQTLMIFSQCVDVFEAIFSLYQRNYPEKSVFTIFERVFYENENVHFGNNSKNKIHSRAKL